MNDADIVFIFFLSYTTYELLLLLILCRISAQTEPTVIDSNRQVTRCTFPAQTFIISQKFPSRQSKSRSQTSYDENGASFPSSS